ncbi:endonuclease domain-containing protein, partial [Mesorhizobium sp. M1E.F.Ca.ET.041.01.1.1]
MPRTRVSFEMRQKARALRVHATKGETLLWYELREFKSVGIKFRRQCPIGPYIVDFACFAVKLIVEVDGDLHEHEKGKRHDAVRDAYLRSLGYDIFRVDEPDVINSAWHVAQVV